MSGNGKAYWCWLQSAFGEGSGVPWHIYNTYPGGLEAFYRAGPPAWRELDYVKPRHFEALSAFSPQMAMARLEYAARMGWEAVTPESEKYPDALRNISDPPAVLYMQGDLSALDGMPWVAVAGARKAGEAGLAAAREIGQGLSSAGAVVVSGMAPGADHAAIQGALMASGRTVTVMPVDLSSTYLAGSAELRRQQLKMGGVLISEYFSQRSPAQGGFQLRNRLITGMCQAVVLIQVAEKSGSMIYARHARKQGRRLFVFPGPPGDPAYAGSRKLLNEGAVPIQNGWELTELWPELFHQPSSGPEPREAPPAAPRKRRRGAPAEKAQRRERFEWPREESAAMEPVLMDPGSAAPHIVIKGERRRTRPEPKEKAPERLAESTGPDGESAAPHIGNRVERGTVPPEEKAKAPEQPVKAAGKEERVLAVLGPKEIPLEELAERTGLDAGSLLRLLSRLELEGRVEQKPGRRYRLGGP